MNDPEAGLNNNMSTDLVKHIVDHHYQQLKKYSREIIVEFDEEAIHRFRVEYKKLRAVFRLLSQGRGVRKEIKVNKKLKKIYTLTGAIRDHQLQVQRVREAVKTDLKKPVEYYYYLHEKIQNLTPKLKKLLIPGDLKKNKDIPKKYLRTASLPDLPSYAEDKWQIVTAIILTGPLFDKNIHTIRKILKDLFYNLKIYQKEGLEAQSLAGEVDKLYFDQLLEELGSFQDKCAAISLLKMDLLHSMHGGTGQQLQKIKTTWLAEKLSMKQKLLSRLRPESLQVVFNVKDIATVYY